MGTTFSLVQKHKSRGIKTWFIRESINGIDHFKTTRTKNKAEAQKIYAEFISSRSSGKIRFPEEIKIDDAIKLWMSSVTTAHGESKTFLAYKSRAKRVETFCNENGISNIGQITPAVAQKFSSGLSSTCSPKTTREIIKIFRSIIRFSTDMNEIEMKDPFRNVSIPKIKHNRAEFWTMEEIEKIIENAPSESYKAFWSLMAYAGLRFSEARNIKAEDINENFLTVVEGKMGKTEDVPISDKLKDVLAPLKENCIGKIFNGKIPLRSDKCIEKLRMAVAAARIENPGIINHHKLRHSFASELMRKGINVKAVQELGRWSSVDTLLSHYAHVKREDLSNAVNKL